MRHSNKGCRLIETALRAYSYSYKNKVWFRDYVDSRGHIVYFDYGIYENGELKALITYVPKPEEGAPIPESAINHAAMRGIPTLKFTYLELPSMADPSYIKSTLDLFLGTGASETYFDPEEEEFEVDEENFEIF